MTALLKPQTDKYTIEISEGPDKGAVFQILPGEIKIGRGETNDIVLNDPRASREHALIRITGSAMIIENLSQNNILVVDGQPGQKAFLSSNSKIQLGSTTFIFRKSNSALQDSRSKVPSSSSQTGYSPTQNKSHNNKGTFYVVVALVAAVLYFLLSESSIKLPSSDANLSIDEEIELSKKRQEELIRQQVIKGKNSRQYLDSQASFMKGLRDFREGFYKNAMISFSAALAIYPEHPTARRYYDLSKLKLDEQIQFHLQEGNRYFEQNKYKSAMSAYYTVMQLIGDSQNKLFEEARTKYKECELLLKGSF